MQSDLFFPSTRSPASFPPDGGPFPFRAEPRTTTDAEIEQENRRNAFKGARAYLPVPDAERIARSARSMSFARLHALLHHPDERVPVALTANPQAFTSDTSTRFGETSKYIRDALYLRAMQEAEEEGVHWTPLLDALADRNLWPAADPATWTYSFAATGQPQVPLVYPHVLVSRLIPWIRDQQSPAAIAQLLRFRYLRLIQLVAEHATCLDDDLTAALLARSIRVAPYLAANSALADRHVRRIVQWVLETLREDLSLHQAADPNDDPAAVTRIVMEVVSTLISRGWTIDKTARAELLEIAAARPADRSTARVGSKDPFKTNRKLAVSILLELGDALEPNYLIRIYDLYRNDSALVFRILKHPAATLEIKRHIARDTRWFPVLVEIASRPDLRHDPVVRPALSRSKSSAVLQPLCLDAVPSDFRDLFRELAVRDPAAAFDVLTRAPVDSRLLRLDDILLILRTRVGVVRSRAVRRLRMEEKPRIRRELLLWLRRRPLADDPPGHEGETAEAYVRPRLRSLIRRAFRSDRTLTLELLQRRFDAIADLVTRKDVVKLLASPDQEIRLAAIMTLAERFDPRSASPRSPRVVDPSAGCAEDVRQNAPTAIP